MSVRFHRQDSTRSITSRASSRTKRDEKRRDRHVTANDDVRLPFPLEVSQSVQDKDEITCSDCRSASPDASSRAGEDDCAVLDIERARDKVRQGVSALEKIIERQQASNEALRRERDAALVRVDELNQLCGKLSSENQSLRDELIQLKTENEQLQQQRLNDWKQHKMLEEKLVRLEACKLSPPRDKHSNSSAQGQQLKDITSDLHVTGLSVGTEAKQRDGSRQKILKSRSQNLLCLHGNNLTVRDHVTSETVTSLPETQQGIRRYSTAMLSTTFPPRPDHQLRNRSGDEVMEVGNKTENTLHLPAIRHRTSST